MLELPVLRVSTAIASRPLFDRLALVVRDLVGEHKYRVIYIEHDVDLVVHFDLKCLGAELVVLLRELVSLWLRKVFQMFEFLVTYI